MVVAEAGLSGRTADHIDQRIGHPRGVGPGTATSDETYSLVESHGLRVRLAYIGLDGQVRGECVFDQGAAEALAVTGEVDKEGIHFVSIRSEKRDGRVLIIDCDPEFSGRQVLVAGDG